MNLEIKNLPTDGDFDPTNAYADTVMDTVLASRLPLERLIVQSFWPPNLDVAAARAPGVALSFLTLEPEGGIDRRTVRIGSRSRRIRLPIRRRSLVGRRATLRLTAVAATPTGDVIRLRTSRRLGR